MRSNKRTRTSHYAATAPVPGAENATCNDVLLRHPLVELLACFAALGFHWGEGHLLCQDGLPTPLQPSVGPTREVGKWAFSECVAMGVPLSLPVAIGIPFAGGALGSLSTQEGIKVRGQEPNRTAQTPTEAGKGAQGWYRKLKKPRWTPPDWLFGPAWAALYAAMGGASWLVWQAGGFSAQAVPLGLYGAQLAMNFAWSPLFFGLKRPAWALADIACLVPTVASCAYAFAGVSTEAAGLMVPYLLWVSYAAALNYRIHRDNPGGVPKGP